MKWQDRPGRDVFRITMTVSQAGISCGWNAFKHMIRALSGAPILFLAFLLLVSIHQPARAHHGVASLSVAGIEGPGAPVETSTSATLPKRSFLGYLKLDYADFEKETPERDDGKEKFVRARMHSGVLDAS